MACADPTSWTMTDPVPPASEAFRAPNPLTTSEVPKGLILRQEWDLYPVGEQGPWADSFEPPAT